MNYKQQKIAFLCLIFVIQTVFLFVPLDRLDETGKHFLTYDFFLLSDSRCTWAEWIYHGCDHLAWIGVFYLMMNEIVSLKRELRIMMILSIIDTLDYFLTFNRVYYDFISWNVATAFVLCWLLLSAKEE